MVKLVTKMSNKESSSKYPQIEDDVKKLIFSEDIQPGDKLPSENELASKYHVSRQTVRKALQNLQNEGYIYAVHGSGTFCSELVRQRKHSKNIAVVMTYLSDYIFPKIIKGIDSVLTEEGYSIILKNTNNSRSKESECLEDLLMKNVDGIIIEPSKSHIFCKHTNLYKKLDEYNIPYIFIQGSYSQMADKPQVLLDDEMGGYMLTEYLIKNGHKNIVGVFKSDDSQGQNRHKGYAKALKEAGIPYDPEKVIWFYTEDRKIHPYTGIIEMVKNDKTIDAVVCYNDQIAMSIIKALSEIGIRVPEDISVTGYDNSQTASSTGLRLTTIVHPQEQLGEMAASMLLKMIRGEQIDHRVVISPELIEGNTVIKR